jgi:type III restriction enzyme
VSAKPDLKQYQENARDQIKSALLALLAKEGQDRLVVFKSPTGSGKTITMAYALSALHTHPNRKEFVVLWLSPGKGKLHVQSARALEFFLTGTSMSVHVLSSRADIEANPTPASGSVLVVNWEKLNRQDGGEFTNVMLRDGETTNFFLMLKNLADAGSEVIAVIDESHLNMDAEKTKRLLSEMRAQVPFITVEMSATPTSTTSAEFRSDGLHHDVVVRFADVEAEGMVRRTALLNEDFASVQKKYPKETLDLQVLNGAWDRVESLRSGYRGEGSKVEPLLLIQYPDGKDADKRAVVVESFLAKKGLVKGKTYAMYLSEEHSEGVEDVAKFDSPFRALIFKQAIATGWDCPRAQVLVQFRDPKSKIFEIQTIGRIMRSPEQHHYANEELNVAYVYSDLPGATVSVVADDPDFKVADTTLARGKAYPAAGLKLHSVFQPRKRELHYPDSKSLEPLLKTEFDSLLLGLLPPTQLDSTSVSFLVDAKVDAKDLLTSNSGDFGTARAGGRMLEGVLSLELAQAIFDRVLTLDIGGYLSREQSRSRIKNILVNWMKSHRPDWNVVHLQHFVLQNQDVVSQAIAAGCMKCAASEDAKAVSAARAKKRDKWDWEIPASELVSSDLYEPSLAGNIVVPALIEKGRSNPEKRFEEWLAAAVETERIVWWWKNGERDEKFLAVEYSYNVQTERTYPDFLVMSTEGKLWVLEVKDIDDPKGAIGGETAHKAVGLASWAADHNKRRAKEKELFAAPEVYTGVVVPYKEGGAMIVKAGDHTNWQPPTKQNLATNTGWEPLGI